MEDFDKWNNIKKNLNNRSTKARAEEKELWWVSVGKNVEVEDSGKGDNFEKPVLVIKSLSRKMFIGIPMTSSQKNEESNYYFKTFFKDEAFFYVLPQIKLFSSKRLKRKIRNIDTEEFNKIKKSLAILLKIKNE